MRGYYVRSSQQMDAPRYFSFPGGFYVRESDVKCSNRGKIKETNKLCTN